ncbi:hypothetical protein HPP92_012321 [Vanilla planifolia]|uniref:Uncharacterized protein n=1 Tax=Vanilla planifolia TaxID=51239 RepID=A0A835V1L9_VANPL|nr:hypothetical protein HPP92_012321 [Vanilla planifolia]
MTDSTGHPAVAVAAWPARNTVGVPKTQSLDVVPYEREGLADDGKPKEPEATRKVKEVTS